ncbi:hypothetical protein [Streptomyces sp. NPDC020951]|uniref:hypothetical protein n=1 Tax=Streptomyces sp. NPDC020951 TaxID=3365104 RepID=UPI0037B6AADF
MTRNPFGSPAFATAPRLKQAVSASEPTIISSSRGEITFSRFRGAPGFRSAFGLADLAYVTALTGVRGPDRRAQQDQRYFVKNGDRWAVTSSTYSGTS